MRSLFYIHGDNQKTFDKKKVTYKFGTNLFMFFLTSWVPCSKRNKIIKEKLEKREEKLDEMLDVFTLLKTVTKL
jgi:hypothetical protein